MSPAIRLPQVDTSVPNSRYKLRRTYASREFPLVPVAVTWLLPGIVFGVRGRCGHIEGGSRGGRRGGGGRGE